MIHVFPVIHLTEKVNNMDKKVNILIAEDENIIALDTKFRLEKLGYKVIKIVNTGEDALEAVRLELPDLILMDIRLNGILTGIEAAEEISKKYHVPIVYLTALTDEETLNLAKKTEPFGYILKPFDEKSLFTSIEMALYKYSTETELKKKSRELEEEKLKTDQLLNNILPGYIVDELKNRGIVSPRLYKNISVLFTDIQISAGEKTLTTEELMVEINEIFGNLDLITKSYGLEKLKTVGDLYIVCGGIPSETDDHAEKIILAAFEIQKYLERRNSSSKNKWNMKAGINSGQAVAGIVGNNKFTYDVWGDTVNVASRLENSSEPGKINISGYTYSLIKKYFNCEYRGKLNVKGKGKIDMYFVNNIKSHYLN